MTVSPARLAIATALLGAVMGGGVVAQSTPRCGGAATGGLPADCTLDAPPLFLGFDYTAAAGDGRRGTLTVTQATAEGGLRDVTGPFEMMGQLAAPALRDVDGDEIPDLLIQSRPTAFDIWRLGDAGFYRSIGRINARSLDDIEARGALTIGRVREASGEITETAYLLDGGEVVTVYRLRIDPGTRTCRMIAGAGSGQDWLNTDVLIAECQERDWN